MIGWTPHESQQRADKRGTATKSLTDISVTNVKGKLADTAASMDPSDPAAKPDGDAQLGR